MQTVVDTMSHLAVLVVYLDSLQVAVETMSYLAVLVVYLD
jgi:hypothetical protein